MQAGFLSPIPIGPCARRYSSLNAVAKLSKSRVYSSVYSAAPCRRRGIDTFTFLRPSCVESARKLQYLGNGDSVQAITYSGRRFRGSTVQVLLLNLLLCPPRGDYSLSKRFFGIRSTTGRAVASSEVERTSTTSAKHKSTSHHFLCKASRVGQDQPRSQRPLCCCPERVRAATCDHTTAVPPFFVSRRFQDEFDGVHLPSYSVPPPGCLSPLS